MQGPSWYILATLDNCQVDSYLVPAHTEWRTKEIDDSYRDDQGNWHTYYRTVTYPDYIPDYYVPMPASPSGSCGSTPKPGNWWPPAKMPGSGTVKMIPWECTIGSSTDSSRT